MTTKAIVTSDFLDGTTLKVVGSFLVVDDTTKIPLAQKGAANGIASLGSDGRVPSGQLPSYIDQVLEYASFAALPAVGISNVIYVTIDTNATYRWSGSAYVELVSSPGTTDMVVEGTTNLYFTNARARSAITVSGGLIYNPSTGLLQGQNLSLYAALASPTFTGTVGSASLGYTGNFTGSAGGTFALGTTQLVKDNLGNVGVGLAPVANNGLFQLGGHSSIKAMFETATVVPAIPGGNIDIMTGAVLNYTTAASATWTWNVRGNASTSLNTLMQVGQSCSVTCMTLQGATPYALASALQIDGVAQTVFWQGGVGPTGNPNSVNVYSFVLVKTGAAVFTVLAAQTNFS